MAALPPPSSSSSSRRTRTGDKVVGSFAIEDEIGKGSFATVYRGTHKATGALVAIKSVNLLKLNKKLKDNLYCEIEILKGLHHPHIVALIDCRESSSHIHLVMEYCELGDLSYFIKKRDKLADNPALKDMVRKYPMPPAGGLNEVVVRHFLKQLSSAMEFLRDRDFIHRDVKPQNLLLLPSPQYIEKTKDPPLLMSASEKALVPMVGLTSLPMLKIADFGFARSLPSTSLAETLCGSPLYMAPEILRYEKYDAKADLWSIGTVLYEMMTGRPPFRATNHVELLRKIEQSEDHIRFPRDAVISSGMKDLIKSLLKRTPVERIEFDTFFSHLVVKEPIPGLVGDDRPREIRAPSKGDEAPISRTPSTRTDRRQVLKSEAPAPSSSPRERPNASSSRAHSDPVRQVSGTSPRHAPQPPTARDQKRPTMVPSATAPNPDHVQPGRPHSRAFNPVGKSQRSGASARSSIDDVPRQGSGTDDFQTREAIAEAEQAVRDAREYVLVEKRAVEVNAFADEMAANPRLQSGARQTGSKAGQITRRATTQGTPSSTTGAVPASPSRAVQIAQGKPRHEAAPRRNSVGKSYGSPSATSAIAKALHGASVRVFGVGWSPHLIGKGMSPPQLYSAFPAYPAPHGTIGLLGDGKPSGPVDEDQKAVNIIEESATRSDVVYGFAEVKYKQLIPLAPSMDHGLGGPPEKSSDSMPEDEGLTVEAVVVLSEEALVLYVKALSLLAKSMDIAGAWWARKSRGEVVSGSHRAESATSVAAGNRINSAVQWVRSRFNEVLEKAEFVRLKLIEAQKQLPEDHPGHPSNHTSSSRIAGASSTDGVVLSSGISAEKLMYDRAIEMSRTAAINEIANEDLTGCEISYITALRMLEAVLENDDAIPHVRRASGGSERDIQQESDPAVNGIKVEDREAVQKVVSMIRTRLTTLRKKMAMIAKHQSMPPSSPRLSTVSHSSSTAHPIGNTPPS